MHQELEELVAAGLPAGEALRAATLTPASILGLDRTRGSVAAGKRADLVLLDADPAADIQNIDRVSAVYTAGRLVVRNPGPAK